METEFDSGPRATNGDVVDLSLFNLLRTSLGDALPVLRCSKATLVHLSHTLEDMVLSQGIPALLFTGFQESSHWREETERYRALAEVAQQVCIFAGGVLPPESSASELHVTLRGDDPLRQEWFVALLCPQFAALLCGQDRQVATDEEATRQFDTVWSFDPAVMGQVLNLLEQVVGSYRPERLAKLQEARRAFPPPVPDPAIVTRFTAEMIRFEEKLHQALAAASRALNAELEWREDLTATLVHDLRSPLQALSTAIEMLQLGGQWESQTTQEMLTIAGQSADELRELVQLILDTNQLAAGQLRIAWQPLKAQSFLGDAVAPLRPLVHARQIALRVDVDPAAAMLWGDGTLLRRVVQNLVGNSVKFTGEDGQIIVSLSPAPGGKRLELRVRDTGRGISSRALPTLFERYSQGSEGDRRGNGLGLYFCRLAAEAHGGAIRATSQVGVGTAITVVLPSAPAVR